MFFALMQPLIFGYLLIWIVLGRRPGNQILLLPLCFGLGFGLLTQIMLVCGIMHIPFYYVPSLVILLMVGLAALIHYLGNTRPGAAPRPAGPACRQAGQMGSSPTWVKGQTAALIFSAPFPDQTSNRWRDAVSFLFTLVIILHLLFIAQLAFSDFYVSWDGFYYILPKAKIFYFEGNMDKLAYLPEPAYPLHVPFALAWMAAGIGGWNEQLIVGIFPAYALMFVLIIYSFLRLFLDRFWSRLGVLLTLSSGFFVLHAAIVYNDFIMMFYNITAIILIWLAAANRNTRLLVLAGLFSGIGTFVKMEGAAYAAIHAALLLVSLGQQREGRIIDKIRKLFYFLLPVILTAGTYLCFKFAGSINVDGGHLRLEWPADYGQRIYSIFVTFLEMFFSAGNWNILWFMLLLSVVLFKGKISRRPELEYLLTALLLFLGFYLFLDLFTPNFNSLSGPHYPTVLGRVILHFFPLCPMLIVLLNAPLPDGPGDEQRSPVGVLRDG